MPVPTTFATLTTPPGATGAELDAAIAFAANLGTFPCTASGTDALTLVLNHDAPTVAAYFNYARFSAIAASDNTTTMTAQVGALSALKVYKDSINGPIELAGGEVQAASLIILTYDSALNSGAGGFHLQTGSSIVRGETLNPSAIVVGSGASLTAMLHRSVSLSFSITPANAVQDVTATLSGVSLTDTVLVQPVAAAMASGVCYAGFIPASGTITIRQLNPTAATIGTVNAAFNITALRIV